MKSRMLNLLGGAPVFVAAALIQGCHPEPVSIQPEAPPAGKDTAVLVPGVTVEAGTLQRLGIETGAVVSSHAGAVFAGTAVVLDSSALAAAVADDEAARADATAARENLERLQRLYDDDGNASRQAVDAARSQWTAARARLITGAAKTRNEWGLPDMAAEERPPSWVKELAEGRTMLVRAEFAGHLPAEPAKLDYALLEAARAGSPALTYVGPSRASAVAAVGTGVMLRIRNGGAQSSPPRPGERLMVTATAPAARERLLVPEAAVIADAGQYWCYVQRPGGRFDRVVLAEEGRLAAGYPVADGINRDDLVVTRGAPLLLSLERGAGSVAVAE